MKNLNDTINYAISLKGAEILKTGNRFCDVIEDLSPQLEDDLSFIRRAYSDQLGVLLYAAVIEGKNAKDHRVGEITNYLKKEEGRDEKWVSRLLKYFQKSIYGSNPGTAESMKTTSKKNIGNTKPFVAKSTIYTYKAPGRLLFLVSIIVQVTCFYLINRFSYHYHGYGVFSYKMLSGESGEIMGAVALLAFALSTILGRDGFSFFNIIPLVVELIVFFVDGRFCGAILVMFYCLLAHIFIDMDEVSEKHHKLIWLDIIILAEIAMGVIIGQYFHTYITMIPIIAQKKVWIFYILEFCSIVMIASYLLNTRKRQVKYRNAYDMKLDSKHEISEIDPDMLIVGFIIGNLITLVGGIIILVTRIFLKEAFSVIVEIGLIRISIVTLLFLLFLLTVCNSTKYVYKDKKWITESSK